MELEEHGQGDACNSMETRFAPDLLATGGTWISAATAAGLQLDRHMAGEGGWGAGLDGARPTGRREAGRCRDHEAHAGATREPVRNAVGEPAMKHIITLIVMAASRSVLH